MIVYIIIIAVLEIVFYGVITLVMNGNMEVLNMAVKNDWPQVYQSAKNENERLEFIRFVSIAAAVISIVVVFIVMV